MTLAVRRDQKWEREARESAHEDACGLALDLYHGRAGRLGPYEIGLALDLYHGRAGRLGPYEIGLALNTDEVLYRQVWARSWTLRVTTELMDGYGRVRLIPPAWRAWGWCQTVITSQRLATRLTLDGGRLESNWWASIAGAEVDLGRDLVTLDDRASSSRGAYGGRAVVIVAVAAVERVHGPAALVHHPALEPLRDDAAAGPELPHTRTRRCVAAPRS